MTHINPIIPAVGDTNWGQPLNAALNDIVTQVNTIDDEIATLAAGGIGSGGGGGAISVVNNGDGTLTVGGNSVIDNGDGTFTVLDSFVGGGGGGEPLGLSDDTRATLATTYLPQAASILASRGGQPALRDIVSVKDFGATGNGTTDDTAAFTAALGALTAAGGGVLFVPSGTYSVTTIFVTASNITISGAAGAVLKRRSGATIDTRVIAVNDNALPGAYLSNITVENLRIDGNNANVTTLHASATFVGAVFVGAVKSVVIRNVYVLNPREIGINLWGCISGRVQGCTVDGMLGDYQVNSINVFGDAFTGNPGWSSPPGSFPSKQIEIEACRVVGNWVKGGDTFSGGGIAICTQGSSDVSVTNCTVDLSGEPAARGRNGTGIFFESGGTADTAVQIDKNFTATGNRVTYCALAMGAVDTNGGQNTTGGLDNYTFADNEIHDSATGIQVNGSNASAVGNTIVADLCMIISTGKASTEQNISVVGNILRPQANSGIRILKSAGLLDGLTIVGNTIDGAASTVLYSTGIDIEGNVRNFVVSSNTIKNTYSSAIQLSGVRAGRIIGNTIINAVAQAVPGDGAYAAGISSMGATDVLAALNFITVGSGALGCMQSQNSPAMIVMGNQTTGGVAATEFGASTRIGGTATGSRGGNTALASLLSGLDGAQIIKNNSTA